MDNLTEQLSRLLEDPGSLKQIMDIAAVVGQKMGTESPLPSDLPEQINSVLCKAQHKDEREDALIHALIPYLRPHPQARLQRAVEVAHLSQLAEIALKTGAPQKQPGDSHV